MNIKIVNHQASLSPAFKALNKEWIDKYFVMEQADYDSLNNPKEYIVDKGGKILYAMENKIPIGVCALIKMDDPRFDYELAKMAVKPTHQGKGIGKMLALAIIEAAKNTGATNGIEIKLTQYGDKIVTSLFKTLFQYMKRQIL